MKSSSKKTRFWVACHVSLLAFSAVVAMIMKYSQIGDPLDPTVVVPFFSIFLMSVLIGYLAIFMVNRAKKYSHQQLVKKMVPALLIFYAAAFVIANIAVTLGVFGWFLYARIDMDDFWEHLFQNELTFATARFLVWLMFFTIAFFYVLWQKSAKREQALLEEKLRFQYSNLKAQVNPHFLFNSLNTLSELVYHDAKQADQFIQHLSGIYRYILDHENKDLVALDQEIEFVKQYFILQQAREADKMFLEIQAQNTDQYLIIPVSLQLLVENAIKHNSCSKGSPLRIKITSENDYVIVSNNIQRKSIMENSTGIGLKNLKERVGLIIKKELIHHEDHNEFIVKMPVIRS